MHRTLKIIFCLLSAMWMASCVSQPSSPVEPAHVDEDGRTVMPMGPLFMPMR